MCVISMAEKYRLLQRATVSEQYPFSWKVFAGWDFAITHPETANLKSIRTANLLRVSLVHLYSCMAPSYSAPPHSLGTQVL